MKEDCQKNYLVKIKNFTGSTKNFTEATTDKINVEMDVLLESKPINSTRSHKWFDKVNQLTELIQ